MASSQVMAVNDKCQQELVEQMLEKSKSIGKSLNLSAQQSAVVSMANTTSVMMDFSKINKDWSGSLPGNTYPATILANNSASFVHVGSQFNGSVGAVVYFSSKTTSPSAAYLLAWSAPTNDTSSNKVYVECGPQANYTATTINWDTIQGRLLNSGPTHQNYDPTTGTNISASIQNKGGYAAVAGVFGLM